MERFTLILVLLSAVFSQNPLKLTEIVRTEGPKRAKEMSLVRHKDILSVTSYSGFITIDGKRDSNTFFWYFPSQVSWLIKNS